MFPNRSSIITKHAAIVCLRQDLTLTNVIVSLDERIIVASILDQQQHLVCNIINTYIPASRTARPDFLRSFLSLPFVQEIDVGPWFLLGDFNLHLHNPTVTGLPAIQPWYDWIRTHFDNCMPAGLPNFQRGGSRSTIDYIFGHHSMMSRVTNANQHFLPTSWTDHSLLTIDLLPVRQDIGRGSWRFNPSMLYDEPFITLLDHTMDSFFDTIDTTPDITPQEQWESLKRLLLKYTAQRRSRGSTSHRRTRIAKLQSERQQLLVNAANTDLATIEQEIDTLIQHDTRQTMLRSATRWHEQGERNNKYFFRVIKARQTQQTITALQCSQNGAILTDIRDIIQETRSYYSKLYTPDEIDETAMQSLLHNIPQSARLSPSDAAELTALPHMADIVDLVEHSPLGKSPGLDGLPFEVYKHLIPRSPCFRHLLLLVIRQAFEGIFPASWRVYP